MQHMTQYAFVRDRIVYDTAALTDAQIQKRAGWSNWPVERYDRCPECEMWTTEVGRLRRETGCPAVLAALA